MAENDKFFQITTMPRKSGISGRLTKLYRKRQLVISVIGAYVLIGGLLGFILFNSAGDRAQASDDIARVTPIIDLIEEDNEDLVIGDAVEVRLTLQNRSSSEAVNNLAVEFFSTKNSVNWTEVSTPNDPESAIVVGQNNTFKLPVLSAGERSTYVAKGILQNEDTNFLTILAKVRYLNREGQQEVHSNRVFTELQSEQAKSDELITLTAPKQSFLPGEEIGLSLDIGESVELSADFELKGSVYFSQYNSDQLTDSVDCVFDVNGVCNVTTALTSAGSYSALFISDDGNIFSNIAQFQVSGATSETAINPQVTVQYPFGTKSINGIVPVFASRVISLNSPVNPSDTCTFEVLQGDQVVTEVVANVRADRTCNVFINATQITTGDGVYGIRLRGDTDIQEVSVVRKASNLATLQTGTATAAIGSPVDVISSTILDIANNPVNGDAVTVGIIHRDSGEYTEFSSIDGQQLVMNNGQFNASLPASYFEKGGLYQVYFETENGQGSDFLSIDYGDDQPGLVYSGVIVDNYENLQVGKNITFSLENITDTSGNTIANGACEAAIYTKSTNTDPIVVGGAIDSGNCNVFVPAGTITTAGPILVSFTAPEIGSDINQSRHFTISPAAPESYGQLNMEYEPVRKNYANNVIIGPLVDVSGNITEAYGMKIEVIVENEIIKTVSDVGTVNGFANVTMPSSSFVDDSIIIKVYSADEEEILTREFILVEDESRLILPVIPDVVSNDENITVSVPNLILNEEESCTVQTYLVNGEEISVDGAYDAENQLCELEWDLNQNRSNPVMLLTVKAGNNKFTNLVNLSSGEAANLFVLTPNVRVDNKDELHIALLTSVITDQFGLPVQEGEMRVQFNGKTKTSTIEDGISSFSITADELSTKDIRQVFDASYLDLNLEASASVLSLNRTNFSSIFLGDKNIALDNNSLEIVNAQSHLFYQTNTIFGFDTEICRAILISENTTEAVLLNTHKQGDVCYVEVNDVTIPSTIVFEEKGYVVGEFDITPVFQTHSIRWCESENCIIQVVAPLNSIVEANVFDEDNVYNFKGNELENIVRINQNGLNPLREYLVEVSFTNNRDQEVTFYKSISGEYLVGQE
jgi:hypothetical protein